MTSVPLFFFDIFSGHSGSWACGPCVRASEGLVSSWNSTQVGLSSVERITRNKMYISI